MGEGGIYEVGLACCEAFHWEDEEEEEGRENDKSFGCSSLPDTSVFYVNMIRYSVIKEYEMPM